MPRSAAIAGTYLCEPCGNTIPAASVVIGTNGTSDEVILWPSGIYCGCGHQMQLRYDEESDHGALPGMHGRSQLRGPAGRRDEDPAGRAGDQGRGTGSLPDRGVHRPAEDRGSGGGESAPGDGGSSRDLPPTASHLEVGGYYRLHGGDYVDCIGELKDVEVTRFDHVFGILDVWAPDGIVPGVRLNADALVNVATPHG